MHAATSQGGSLGPFFSFPKEGSGKDDLGSADLLRSLLTETGPETALEDLQASDFLAASGALPQEAGYGLQAFVPSAFPANRFEVVAENTQAIGSAKFQQDMAGFVPASRFDASSSGGTQPEFSGRGAEDNSNAHRERNRAAQKKFRERQKARQANNSRRLEDLERQMAQLLQDKKGLESQNKLLQHTVMVNNTFHTELQARQEAYEIQQEVLLMDTARIYSRGLDTALTVENTKQYTMETFLKVFEHFITRYRLLLETGGMDPTTRSGEVLHDLVAARRLEEARIALFSRWSSATLAWNREETRSGNHQPPSVAFYAQLLTNLHLSPGQEQEWVAARRRLLYQLEGVRRRREKVALSLGLLLLQNEKPDGSTMEERQLRDSLEEEREAVLAFMHTVIDCNMAPTQEAVLDVSCHPWWPCLWTLCNILASKQKKEPADTLTEEGTGTGLFPQFSAAELLKEPLLARMGGLQLKRTIISVPMPENVLAAAHTAAPKIADMRSMTVFEVMCGKHLEGLALSS